MSIWPRDPETVHLVHLCSLSQPLEAPIGRVGLVSGVPEIAMAEVILDEAKVIAFVG